MNNEIIVCFFLPGFIFNMSSQHFQSLFLEDKFVTVCQKITEEIDEAALNVEFEFQTEKDMVDNGYSQCHDKK